MIQTPLTTNQSEARSDTTTGKLRAESFWSLWRWWLPPALIALSLVLYFTDPFIGDWDGVDYTILSLAGYPSSMALGRNLFIFGNHALFVIARSVFGLEPENAYLLFKYTVVAQAPLTVIVCWRLAQRFSESKFTATTAALLVTFSPVFVLYGGQVMTDVPSVLLLVVSLLVHLRGIHSKNFLLIMAGAALMGLGVNLRETIGLYLPWLLFGPFVCGWKVGKRELGYVALSLLVFTICAFGWFAYWFITDPYYRGVWFGWRESMRQESSRHPVTIGNLGPYLMYFFISAPLVFISLPFAPIREWRMRRLSPLLFLWVVGLVANLMLFFNYSTTVNWRYFLTGLPALVPLGAHSLLHVVERVTGSMRSAFITCIVVIASLALIFAIYLRPISSEFIERRAMSKQYKQNLQAVPSDAVMISGAQTIAVIYWKAIGLGQWQTIGTGGGWPGDGLFSEIQNHLSQGRRVFLDSDPRWWSPCGWQKSEIPLIVELEKHFAFRRVTENIFEVRPLSDQSATDEPNLERLLPENRPEDTVRCPLGRS